MICPRMTKLAAMSGVGAMIVVTILRTDAAGEHKRESMWAAYLLHEVWVEEGGRYAGPQPATPTDDLNEARENRRWEEPP